MIRILLLALLGLAVSRSVWGLSPGFSAVEYQELLRVSARQQDTPWTFKSIPYPERYDITYRSPTMGPENRWDLWLGPDSTAVISLRGTTEGSLSWLENFYSAMVPATGEVTLSNNQSFCYTLSTNPQAAVHVGWVIGLAYLGPDIVCKLNEIYPKGYNNIYIMGHSQGGAIAYLLTSYLYYLKKEGRLPADLKTKTYCSAAPKPGNLFYAYDYESITAGGWSFTVVNPVDWVPQTPVTTQIIDDFHEVNPFKDAEKAIKTMKWPERWAVKYAFRRIDKPARRTVKNFRKYLGHEAFKVLEKQVPGIREPAYINSYAYVRTGTAVVLQHDASYAEKFPNDPTQPFIHHFILPYYHLAMLLP